MPLFHHHKDTTPEHEVVQPQPPVQEKRSSGFFGGRRQSVSPSTTSRSTAGTRSVNGTSVSPQRHNGSVLHRRSDEDPSISAARDRVFSAEAAERDADRALQQARQAVRLAREHVRKLEQEAAEEARLAKIKQDQAASISKRAKPLGRFDRF
ncbi:hypothetical protein F5884DRAFT_896437 [Xylogone sp. PMI_703]|nr:hypothetical protein F5884DRAFT_896437 [Xylogone sp. PMI_703]